MQDKTALRARDFWTALVLIGVALFFLWRTTNIPLFETQTAGVSGGDWYNSAALVPYGIFGLILILGIALLVISIRDGGAAVAFRASGLEWDGREAIRLLSIAVILFFYIFALLPRVDFVISSALVITALIFGFHEQKPGRMAAASLLVLVAGTYAVAMHFGQAEWNAPHDDDWVALAAWAALVAWMLIKERDSRVMRMAPALSLIVPVILVAAMAFGFRQNVPNRGGLIFSQLEYHYYVNIRPLWAG